FGIDVKLPLMLTAVIARPPVFGAKPSRIEDSKAKQIAGVKAIVQVPAGIAVVANGFWPAKLGREWEEGPNSGISTADLRQQYARLATTPGRPARRDGDDGQALRTAATQVTAEYEVPYL